MNSPSLANEQKPQVTTPLATSSASIVKVAQSPSQKKLGAAMVAMDDFNESIRERTATKKEKYNYDIASLKVRMTDLERELEAEINLRQELQARLQAECEDHIDKMQKRFERLIDERTQTVKSRLDLLTEKVDHVNSRIMEESNRIPRDIETKSRELGQILKDLQEEFLVERETRVSRESQILSQLAEHERQIELKFLKYEKDRKDLLNNLSKIIEKAEEQRSQDTIESENNIKEEIKNLHEMLSTETHIRKQEDDDIIIVIDKYMNQIQDSVARLSL